jgi:hypothetical protein
MIEAGSAEQRYPFDLSKGETHIEGTINVLDTPSIRRDGQTQHRAALDSSVINHYAALMMEGVTLPPVTVWFDGDNY